MDLMTPEENDEFNRIERESASVRQEAIKDSLWRKRKTMNDIALLTQIVRDMSARITQLEKGMQLDPLPTTSPVNRRQEMSIEAMKQWLEALEDVGVLTDREWQAVHKNKANELRQAIAEAEKQEPVAWMDSDWHYQLHKKGMVVMHKDEGDVLIGEPQPLYTHPQQRTWFGLSEDEITQEVGDTKSLRDVVKNIEYKLMRKNT